jgi:GxxExxY protein
MNTERVLKHQELTARIIRVFFEVYNELGFGFLESVYAEALGSAFREAGLTVEREMPLEVRFRGRVVGQFRADLVVGGAVLVETKACHSGIKRLAFDNSRKVRLTNASMEVEHRRSASPRIDPSSSALICG